MKSALLEAYSSVLSHFPGRARNFKYRLFFKDTTPVRKAAYYPPTDKLARLEEHVNQLVDLGVLSPCQSPYATPVFWVPKKTGNPLMRGLQIFER